MEAIRVSVNGYGIANVYGIALLDGDTIRVMGETFIVRDAVDARIEEINNGLGDEPTVTIIDDGNIIEA